MTRMKKIIHFFDRFAFKILILWVIVLSVLYSTLSIVRHNHFQSGGFDLGLYDQTVWQYSRFLWPYNTIKDRFILGDHLTLTLPLLSPLFWLWDDVRILLVFQAVAIASSSVAIFLLAKFGSFQHMLRLSSHGHTVFLRDTVRGILISIRYCLASHCSHGLSIF